MKNQNAQPNPERVYRPDQERAIGRHSPMTLGEVALRIATDKGNREAITTARFIMAHEGSPDDPRAASTRRDALGFIALMEDSPRAPALLNGAGFQDPSLTHVHRSGVPQPEATRSGPFPPEPAVNLQAQPVPRTRSRGSARARFMSNHNRSVPTRLYSA